MKSIIEISAKLRLACAHALGSWRISMALLKELWYAFFFSPRLLLSDDGICQASKRLAGSNARPLNHIKTFVIGGLFIVASSSIYAVPSSINAPISGSGWRYNQHNPGGYYEGISGANDGYSWDINYGNGWEDDGMPVYAVESGCIYTGNGWGGDSYGQLLINHTTGSDQWSTGYLHMKNKVKVSGCVSKGDKIGEVSRTGYLVNSAITSPHLHFAVYNSNGKYGLTSVNANIKEVTYPLISDVSANSYFDGTGSLVDPRGTGSGCASQNGNGCSNDLVKLHPHNVPSTALFQVVGVSGVCESLELSGLSGGANVELRSWAGYGAESLYYKLDSLPAVIPLKNVGYNNGWNLIALTTTSPVPQGSTKTIQANCVSFSYQDSRVHAVSGVPTQFAGGYYWGGNGSLIGHSNSQDTSDSISGYGKFVDVAVLMRDQKTISAFQVTKSSCNTLRFKTPVPFTLSWKVWDSADWLGSQTINNGEALTLPSSIGNWAVLLIQAPATNANNSRVEATCE